MDTKSAAMEWPDELVRILASDIEIAQSINDRSWSIFTYRNRPVFGVSNNTLLSFDPVSGSVGTQVDPTALSQNSLEWRSRFGGGSGADLWFPHQHLSQLPEEILSAHHEWVRKLARHRNNRWKWFRLDFHEAFSKRLGAELPLPGYLDEWRANRERHTDKTVDMIHESEPVELTLPSSETGVSTFLPTQIGEYFASHGLNYTNTQLADFYTALQTKGFVVLSGISGTGKSKIATGFTELLPYAGQRARKLALTEPNAQTLIFHTKLNKSAQTGGTAILQDQASQVDFIDPGQTMVVPSVVENVHGDILIQKRGVGKRLGYPSLEYSKEIQSQLQHWPIGTPYRVQIQLGDSPFGTIERTDGGFNESENLFTTDENTLFLSVRPDWRDSTSLLGYYNPLTQTYEWTRFLQFILDAAKNYQSDDPIAWFVILDEMNLAHVEYYFADLLSVLESGRVTNPNDPNFGFTSQPLRLTYPDNVQNDAPPTEVHLPPNLYIIGTVNMDETTHAFSPKVLDRAFSMELTEVDFTDYPRHQENDTKFELAEAAKREFLQSFSQDGKYPQIRKEEIREYVHRHETVRNSLQALNAALADYRFHFGYRVFDEIIQFLVNAELNELYESSLEAFDSAVFMKVLPKFSGSEARVGEPLQALITWASNPFGSVEEAEPLQRSLARAKYMARILEANGFVTAF